MLFELQGVHILSEISLEVPLETVLTVHLGMVIMNRSAQRALLLLLYAPYYAFLVIEMTALELDCWVFL